MTQSKMPCHQTPPLKAGAITHSPRNRSGFTLVEVALAATILLVGFAGMAEALIIGSEMLDTARKQTIAAQIMQSGNRIFAHTTLEHDPRPGLQPRRPIFRSALSR